MNLNIIAKKLVGRSFLENGETVIVKTVVDFVAAERSVGICQSYAVVEGDNNNTYAIFENTYVIFENWEIQDDLGNIIGTNGEAPQRLPFDEDCTEPPEVEEE